MNYGMIHFSIVCLFILIESTLLGFWNVNVKQPNCKRFALPAGPAESIHCFK